LRHNNLHRTDVHHAKSRPAHQNGPRAIALRPVTGQPRQPCLAARLRACLPADDQCGAPTRYSGLSLSTRTVTFFGCPPTCTVQSNVVPFSTFCPDGHETFFTSGSP